MIHIINLSPLLAEMTGDSAIDSLSVLVFKILFLVGVLIIASGSWAMRGGQFEVGVMGIVAGMIMALAYPIMSGFYDKAGMSSAKLKLSYSVEQKHDFNSLNKQQKEKPWNL